MAMDEYPIYYLLINLCSCHLNGCVEFSLSEKLITLCLESLCGLSILLGWHFRWERSMSADGIMVMVEKHENGNLKSTHAAPYKRI